MVSHGLTSSTRTDDKGHIRPTEAVAAEIKLLRCLHDFYVGDKGHFMTDDFILVYL